MSRLLAYFSEHAFCHLLVGRALGIRFTGYGLHGTSHPQHYPPDVRWVFSRLPLMSARTDPSSLKEATPAARAAMYSAGTVATVIASVAIPGYAWWRGVSRARGFFVGTNLRSVSLLLSETLRRSGDLRHAWRELAKQTQQVGQRTSCIYDLPAPTDSLSRPELSATVVNQIDRCHLHLR